MPFPGQHQRKKEPHPRLQQRRVALEGPASHQQDDRSGEGLGFQGELVGATPVGRVDESLQVRADLRERRAAGLGPLLRRASAVFPSLTQEPCGVLLEEDQEGRLQAGRRGGGRESLHQLHAQGAPAVAPQPAPARGGAPPEVAHEPPPLVRAQRGGRALRAPPPPAPARPRPPREHRAGTGSGG